MQFRLAVAAVAVCVLYLNASAHAQTRYIVPTQAMYEKFLPAVKLSGMEGKTDINNAQTIDQWLEKGHVEGFGIAFAVLTHLKKKITGEWTQEQINKTKILIVGGLGGNTLGALHAAIYLANLGIQSDIYIIQNEDGKPTLAEKYSKPLISQIQANRVVFANVNIVYCKDVDSVLEGNFGEVVQLKQALADAIAKPKHYAERAAEMQAAAEKIKKFLTSQDKEHFNFGLGTVNKYNLVLDAICGASLSHFQVKFGTCKALNILLEAISLSIDVLSVDFASLWLDNGPSIPEGYTLLGYKPVMPNGVIHIGSLKPFVFAEECKKMAHYVVLPEVLSAAMDTFVDTYRRNSPNMEKIFTIVPASGSNTANEVVLTIPAQYILVGTIKQNKADFFWNYFTNPAYVENNEVRVY